MSEKKIVDTILDVKSWMREKDCTDAMDCIIDELHSRVATEINNRGTDGRVKYMVKLGYTSKEIIDCIKEELGDA